MEVQEGQLAAWPTRLTLLLCSASCLCDVLLIGIRNLILISAGSIFSAGAIPWDSWWWWNPALVNASTKNTLWYNATFNIVKEEERVCKQAGEYTLLLSKWRNEICGSSKCLDAGLQSRPELHCKWFLKFLLEKRDGKHVKSSASPVLA